MKTRPGEQSFKTDPRRAELLALYAEVDALLAPFSCDASTDCCRFGVTGREPYPTAIELAEVERAARSAGALSSRSTATSSGDRGRGGRGRALPMAERDGEGERRCPLLSAEGRCRIYASRPFGCRTFFCERATGPGKMPRQEVQRISRAVADLAARFDPRDPGPRPLTRALARLTGGG